MSGDHDATQPIPGGRKYEEDRTTPTRMRTNQDQAGVQPMSGIIVATETNPGGRKYNEDRCAVKTLTTRGGLRLAAAVVSDGVGGEERGERAAQLAVDGFMGYLDRSEDTTTIEALTRAVQQANTAAFGEASRLAEGNRMAATMVAAAVENGETLYIANAGDSRAYLCRDGKLIQLTRDHSFANVMVWTGKMTAEAAAEHPEASMVMRALGVHERIQVDLGIYETTNDYAEANQIGQNGLKLKAGDAILLCSDGLVKPTPATGQTLITQQEIVHILQTQEGEKALQAAMSLTLGRIPVGEAVDNITVAMLQKEDPSRPQRLAERQKAAEAQGLRAQRRKVARAVAGVGIPLGLLLLLTAAAFAKYALDTRSALAGTATRLAEATLFAGTAQSIALAPPATETPVPLPTPFPTAVYGEIAKAFDGNTAGAVIEQGERALVLGLDNRTRSLAVTYQRYLSADPDAGEDGHIYLAGDTRLVLGIVSADQFQVTILPGSEVLVQTGPYDDGAVIELADSMALARVRGCLAISYVDDRTYTAACLQGECSYSTGIGNPVASIEEGSLVTLTMGQAKPASRVPIPQRDYSSYIDLLVGAPSGRADLRRCLIPGAPGGPLPTATSEPTASVEAATPTAASTP
jgi:protein phosphatase